MKGTTEPKAINIVAGNYEEKFEKLKTFYEKGLNQVGWNKYSRISLEFNNQIICTKKEK